MIGAEKQRGGNIDCSLFSCEEIYDPRIDISRLKHSDRFTVCLVVSGSGIHRVMDQEIPCSVGDICIIPPGVSYGYYL